MSFHFEEIRETLKQELKPDRYEHTLGVMYTAGALAMAYGEDHYTALLAGLLHDCAKCIPVEKMLEMCEKNSIALTEAELAMPQLIHAKLGAFVAKEKYHVTDEKILHAILVHTTGCPDMSPLDKILFIADYIEPNRDKQQRLSEIRQTAFQQSLDDALRMILKDSLDYLKKNDTIDPMTEVTYEYYKRMEGDHL